MRKCVRPLLALAMLLALGASVSAGDRPEGYGDDFYASQIGFDSFNQSVKLRLAAARVGAPSRYFGAAPLLSSDDAYAAPSSRNGAYPSSGRRQLDCVYYSGFTVWADFYQTWARQRTKGGGDGYKYRATGPALGFDWSNGPLTIGVATTYNWGKLKGKSTDHDRKHRAWAFELYGQYDMESFYINGSLAYAYNRFRSTRPDIGGTNDARYHSNAWNADAEFGYKLNFSNFKIVPNVGLRYYNERRGNFLESGPRFRIDSGRRGYHVMELPLAVDVSYEIQAGQSIIVPRLHAAWVPELFRKRGNVDGGYYDGGVYHSYNANGAKRSRQGFELGLGIEAKITRSISAHLDYQADLRPSYYAHRWNLGIGMTF